MILPGSDSQRQIMTCSARELALFFCNTSLGLKSKGKKEEEEEELLYIKRYLRDVVTKCNKWILFGS